MGIDVKMRRAVCQISDGDVQGIVIFSQSNETAPVKVEIRVRGFLPGQIHAIHVHEYGDVRQGCESLGGHWNPLHVDHGHSQWTPTHHAGDLVNNIVADASGAVEKTFTDPSLTLFGDDSIMGRSIVIHESMDDLGLCGVPLYVEGSSKKPPVLLYKDIPESELRQLIQSKGLTKDQAVLNGSKTVMVRFLEKGSLTTGNAGKRLGCGIIGRCK